MRNADETPLLVTARVHQQTGWTGCATVAQLASISQRMEARLGLALNKPQGYHMQ